MKKSFLRASVAFFMASSALHLASCGGQGASESAFPANFATIGDGGRVAYVMNRVSPDSLARFIIYASLGRVEGARIDTLAIATNYAYERLRGDNLDKFSSEYDAVVEGLPLADKMKIYRFAGTEDPQGLGYRLGLEYMTTIRDGGKTVVEVERELKEFKKACGSDTAMYRRFIIGFHTVLEVDHSTDVSEDIYNKFVNYE